MTLRVEHVTAYHYANRVELAAHVVHLRPRSLPWQTVRQFALAVDPAPDLVRWGTDHFGNDVAWLFMDQAHDFLRIAARGLVTVEARPAPEWTPAWEHVAEQVQQPDAAREVAEFAFASPRTPLDPAARAYAASSFPPGRAIMPGLVELMGRIRRDFRFDPEATTVSTPVARVMQGRAGVCQDFAHLMIAGLRGLGLPARYVSGYLRTVPPPGQERMRGADVSHAWVSAWLGAEHGWIDLDPTNDIIVADGHVCLGWGRDYADISPVHGVLLGGGRHTLRVSVDIEDAVSAGAGYP